MKHDFCLVNRQKWRVSQYLSLYLGEPYTGERLALGLCELDASEGKTKPVSGVILDYSVPHGVLQGIGKLRLQSLQRLQARRLEERSVATAIETMIADGATPYANIGSTLIHYTDWHLRALPGLSSGKLPTWDFKIAMLNAVYQPAVDFNEGYSYSRNGYKTTVIGLSAEPPWGQLFSCFVRRHEGRSSAAVATMILTNWYKNGVLL